MNTSKIMDDDDSDQEQGKTFRFEDQAYKMYSSHQHQNHLGPQLISDESSFPLEAYMMVTQLHWEDDIIWGTEPEATIKQMLVKSKSRAISISQDNLTDEEYPHVQRWEDKIIWDADNLPVPDIPEQELRQDSAQDTACDQSAAEKWLDRFNSSPGVLKRNPFNISNDEYYQPCFLKEKQTSLDIRHAFHAQMIDPLLFPTNLPYQALDKFHRVDLKRLKSGTLSSNGPHGVLNLNKVIQHDAKRWEKEVKEGGSSSGIFWANTIEDLSGRNGTIVLMEYSEEHPPLLGQIGMNSLIRNYAKRVRGQDSSAELQFGEQVPSSQPLPYLGALEPGKYLQSLENNMYRAPVFQHRAASTDFLMIRTSQHYFIREIDGLFAVGQQCPLMEVPAPRTRDLRDIQKRLLKHWVFRKLMKCQTQPPTIKVSEVLEAFPSVPSSSLKKLLPFAHVVKTDVVFKPECVLPTEDELTSVAIPEQWCAFWSSKAAEQRLKTAGYLEKHLIDLEDEESDQNQEKVKDEIKAAPWNTTKTFLAAMKGKCMLQVYGPADPTGCGEAFSYSRASRAQHQDEKLNVKKGPIQGSQWDLRRLNKARATIVLKSMGVGDARLKGLGRSELVRLLRSISKDKALKGDFTRFARVSGVAMTKEWYKEECQRIFQRQNRSLASGEIMSSEDESSDSEYDSDVDVDELGKKVEVLLEGDKTRDDIIFENEELERKALKEAMLKDPGNTDEIRSQQTSGVSPVIKKPRRILKIERTYLDDQGQEYIRTEIVIDPAKIDLYVKYRTSETTGQKNDEWTSRKKKSTTSKRRIKDESPNAVNVKAKCGACGTIGHFRTNKACPMYSQTKSATKVRSVSTSDQTTALTKVEGVKLTFSKAMMVNPKEKCKKIKGTTNEMNNTPPKKIDRRRTDPKVCMSNIFESIWKEMSELPNIDAFRLPVSARRNQVGPSYFEIVKKPMDLQTIRHKIREKQYEQKSAFEDDAKLIYSNSEAFNGSNHPLTLAAYEIMRLCITRLQEKGAELTELENQINPLKGPDDLKSLNYILRKVLDKLKTMKIASMFLKPVNKKAFPDYYKTVQTPIDISAIGRKVDMNLYRHRDGFLGDLKLLSANAELYNGPDSDVTAHSKLILEHAEENLHEFSDILTKLEKNLKKEKRDSDSEEDDLDGPHSTGSSSSETDDSDEDTSTANASTSTKLTAEREQDEPRAKKPRLSPESKTSKVDDAHKSDDENFSQLLGCVFDLQPEAIHNLADNLDLSAFSSDTDEEIEIDALAF